MKGIEFINIHNLIELIHDDEIFNWLFSMGQLNPIYEYLKILGVSRINVSRNAFLLFN